MQQNIFISNKLIIFPPFDKISEWMELELFNNSFLYFDKNNDCQSFHHLGFPIVSKLLVWECISHRTTSITQPRICGDPNISCPTIQQWTLHFIQQFPAPDIQEPRHMNTANNNCGEWA